MTRPGQLFLPKSHVRLAEGFPVTDVIDRYAGWLPLLSKDDRAYARTRYAEVLEIRAADPTRDAWFELSDRGVGVDVACTPNIDLP
jgi:hypothetical protein